MTIDSRRSNETTELAHDAEAGDASRVTALETELRGVRRRLAVREKALAVLNRRLLKLERGENGAGGMVRALGSDYARIQDLSAEVESDVAQIQRLAAGVASGEARSQALSAEVALDEAQIQALSAEGASLREANRVLQEELFWLRNSRVYRWSGPVRGAYHKVRRR
jgi:chromosome segregation ATPase